MQALEASVSPNSILRRWDQFQAGLRSGCVRSRSQEIAGCSRCWNQVAGFSLLYVSAPSPKAVSKQKLCSD